MSNFKRSPAGHRLGNAVAIRVNYNRTGTPAKVWAYTTDTAVPWSNVSITGFPNTGFLNDDQVEDWPDLI